MLIGELEGAVSTDSLTFEAFKDVEQFDFVTVKNPKEGQEWILCQIDSVTKHPDGKTEAEAQVIGYRENGMLKQPRHVVEPDAMVYRADEDVIAETLGLTQDGLYMGRLDTNPDIRIFLDPEELYKHIAVLAKTGAGKSYATGVMIEELLEQDYPVLIIDPHGEYHSLAHPNEDLDDEAQEKYDIEATGYDITEYSTDTEINPKARKLTFTSNGLDAKELEQLVPTNLTNSQLEVLYNALKDLKNRDSYDLDDIIDTCMNQESKAKWNLVNILEVVQDSNLFGDAPTPLDELVQPGKASIVNLKGVDPETQEMVVYKLAKALFEKRKRGQLQPFMMVMEEAHNFVPERNFGKAVCSDILRTIASEGRKFGLGIGVISQRPARVDKNILSQCNTQIILRVTNPNDLNAISRSFEGVTSEVKNFITALPPGVGLLLGKEYPVMTDIRTRRSLHGGATKELSRPDSSVDEPADEGPEPEEAGLKPGIAEPEPDPDVADQDAAEPAGETEPEPDEDLIDPAPGPDPAAADAAEETAAAAGEEMATEAAGMADAEEVEEAASAASAGAASAAMDIPSDDSGGADAAPGPETDSGAPAPDTGMLTAIHPTLSFDKLQERVDGARVAYYPLWLVDTDAGTVAVDATDGEVKAVRPMPAGVAGDVMELLQRGDRSRGDLLEALDIPLNRLQAAVDRLAEAGAVAQDGDVYTATLHPAFEQDREQVDPGEHTVIDTDIDEGEARTIATEVAGGEATATEKVYYPYYTAGNRVFDAVKGEEV